VSVCRRRSAWWSAWASDLPTLSESIPIERILSLDVDVDVDVSGFGGGRRARSNDRPAAGALPGAPASGTTCPPRSCACGRAVALAYKNGRRSRWRTRWRDCRRRGYPICTRAGGLEGEVVVVRRKLVLPILGRIEAILAAFRSNPLVEPFGR